MRIRKRTPARTASPGPEPLRAATFSPPPPPPPHPPPPQQHPKQEGPQEEQQVEEKASLVVGAGEREEDRVLAAVSKNRATDVPKPDPEPLEGAAARPAARCSRNDGKQWRCKGAAVQGYLFCDRHVAWSTRKRKPRASRKNRGGSILDGSERAKEENAAEGEDAATTAADLQCNGGGGGDDDDDDGFYYYGGFQPGSRKRVKSSAAGQAA